MTTPDTSAAGRRKAEVEAARAALPVAASTPLGAAPAVGEGAGFLARWVTHQTLQDLADALVARLDELPDVTGVLLVEDRDLVARDWAWAHVTDELARRRRRAEESWQDLTVVAELLPTPEPRPEPEPEPDLARLRAARGTSPVSPLEVAGTHVAAAADLVGLLSSEWTVTPTPVPTTTAPLTALVAERLLAAHRTVLVDRFRLVRGTGPVQRALEDTVRATARLADARRAVVARLPEPADDEPDVVGRARAAVVAADEVLAEWRASLTALTTVGADGASPLAAAAVQAALHGADPAVSHVVALSLDSAGADVVTRRHLFLPAGRLWLVGGATASWLVHTTGPDARLAQSGSLRRTRRVRYDLASGEFDGARDDAGDHDDALGTAAPLSASGADVALAGAAVVGGLLLGAWLVVDVLQKAGVVG